MCVYQITKLYFILNLISFLFFFFLSHRSIYIPIYFVKITITIIKPLLLCPNLE